ncbi:hypothetical protein [Corynebacterium macclintockiae]|uniref:hypothetical protein n=1 Tax=Corynebacterium macclintockiae TaxID=2913501 RepID=UPI003EBF5743
MARTRQSAKAAGARFERLISDHLRDNVSEYIDRRVKTGARDRGDISNVRSHGERVVVECKNTARPSLAQWIDEAHTQAGNDDAAVGIIIHKRHGVADPGRQWVTMCVDDLIFFLTGELQESRYEP